MSAAVQVVRAASWSGSSQARIAKSLPPRMSADCNAFDRLQLRFVASTRIR